MLGGVGAEGETLSATRLCLNIIYYFYQICITKIDMTLR